MTAMHGARTKRSEIFWDTDAGTMRELLRLSRYIETLSSEHGEHFNSHRRWKRDTSHYLNDVVHEIQAELENLETSMDLNTSMSNGAAQSNSTEKVGIRCFIETNGKVNCSNVIYENEKSWKKSRDQVDLLIQVLKTKIVELKDIRRHLKDHKPKNATNSSEEADEDDEDVSETVFATSTEDSDETTEKMVVVQKQTRRPHQNKNSNQASSRRPHRVHLTTAAISLPPSLMATTTTTTSTTSNPRSTTIKAKIVATAHPVSTRRGNQTARNATTPAKVSNTENTHRHHHLYHAKMSSNDTGHPTKRKMAEDSVLEPSNVDTKSEKRHKFNERIDLDVDQSRAECFCEPDTDG